MSPKTFFRTIDAYVRTKLGRYVRPRRYKQIFDEIERVKPKVIVEVGTWNGRRAMQMIELAAKYNPVGEINYIGFDLFEKLTDDLYQKEISKRPPTEADVQKFLSATGARIKLLAGFTSDTMKNIGDLPKADLVFIDGGHATETVRNDWEGIEKVMQKGTVVIFDDYWQNRTDGPKPVIDAIDRNKYKVEIMPETDVFFNPDFGRLVISLAKVTRL